MENLINHENFADLKELVENKIAAVPAHYLLYGAIGSLLLASYLKKTGHHQAGSFIGKLSVPIIAIGVKKYSDLLQSESDVRTESQAEHF